MQPLCSPHAFREGCMVVMSTVLGVGLGMGWPACAAVESGVFQTLPGATVDESGDRDPNEYRAMPITATLTFDLSATQPSLTAQIADALLEGDDPFPQYATSLPAAGWSAVANSIATTGNRCSITVTTDESQRFYRLRKL